MHENVTNPLFCMINITDKSGDRSRAFTVGANSCVRVKSSRPRHFLWGLIFQTCFSGCDLSNTWSSTTSKPQQRAEVKLLLFLLKVSLGFSCTPFRIRCRLQAVAPPCACLPCTPLHNLRFLSWSAWQTVNSWRGRHVLVSQQLGKYIVASVEGIPTMIQVSLYKW